MGLAVTTSRSSNKLTNCASAMVDKLRYRLRSCLAEVDQRTDQSQRGSSRVLTQRMPRRQCNTRISRTVEGMRNPQLPADDGSILHLRSRFLI
jgi:hypothetical protein